MHDGVVDAAGAAVFEVGAGAFDGQQGSSEEGVVASECAGRFLGEVMEGEGVHLQEFIEGEGDWIHFHLSIVSDVHVFLSIFRVPANGLKWAIVKFLSFGIIRGKGCGP
ncbi:MAG: hypothetical protein J0I12_34730 [Candidatus Eremiobacteraeota bacterium]|nr:hypothetical protein [Candidatus Eremiobacteraeota bacterium]